MSEALKNAVTATGESVTTVARGAGIPQPVLYRFMTGERDLRLQSAEKLAAFLGLELRPVPPAAEGPQAEAELMPDAAAKMPLFACVPLASA